MFKWREYSLVRIWWRPNCKLTNDRRLLKETLCISGLWNFLAPWLQCLLLVPSNRFKPFSDCHPGLVRFPMLSMWSLQQYGAAVPAVRSSVPPVYDESGIQVGVGCGMIYLLENSDLTRGTEWSGRSKCLFSNWSHPVLIEDRCPFVLFLNSPLVSPQRAHSMENATCKNDMYLKLICRHIYGRHF